MESPSGKIKVEDEVDRSRKSPTIERNRQDTRSSHEYEEEATKNGTDGIQTDKGKQTVHHVIIQKKNSRYYFQHPYLRLFIAYFIIFCNFLIYAEDPVSHSLSPCTIPVVGNVFAFVVDKYPPAAGWCTLKFIMWFTGLIVGLLIGKFFIHKLLLRKWMKLSMFQQDKGSWMVMFLTAILFIFIFSLIFNGFVTLGGSSVASYKVTSFLGFTNKTFMKAAGMGTWMGDFVTAWMVTDMMLQDKLYPNWNVCIRKWWKTGWNRIIMFWVVLVIATVIVATAITTDYINWDLLNRDFVSTNELSRAVLASVILVFDLSIIMQDWDFPQFRGNMDIKLPGVDTASIHITLPRCVKKENWAVHITGKWFNYGIIMLVIILDLNMWKNQIFYSPFELGQYVDKGGYIYSIENKTFLAKANKTMLSYDWRWTHPSVNQSYGSSDYRMNAKYLGFSLGVKSVAFIPSIAAFLTFGLLIWFYGREEFVVDAVIVDGASIQGIVIDTYDSYETEKGSADEKVPITSGNEEKKGSRQKQQAGAPEEETPLSKQFVGANSEVATEDVTGPKLVSVLKITYV